MDFIKILTTLFELLHLLVRFLPLGVFFFTYLSSALYKDLRSAILLSGLLINELFGYLYKKRSERYKDKTPVFSEQRAGAYSNDYDNTPEDIKTNCALFGVDKSGKEFDLNNSHTEFMAFLTSFYFSDMYYKQKLDVVPFITLIFITLLTIWSRMSKSCETPKQVVQNMILGIIFGLLYYYLIKDYYLDAERNSTTKDACNLGYDNYRCSEIKDGKIIEKK
tara:strand:+ start:2922 stop:3584 length:663 start_codon:yes stop_codon:yes gene_type:complete